VQIQYDTMYIGGEWRRPAGDATIHVVSASTEESIGGVPEATDVDVDAAVDAARRVMDDPAGWPTWEPERRAEVLERLAAALERRADQMVRRVSAQNGMPVAVARKLEAGFPPVVLRYYAGLIRDGGAEERRPGMLGGTTLVRREPIGVVAAIVPWNFPQTLASFKYAAAMAAGCSIVLKPSPETVLDAYLLAEAAAEAEVPAGVLNIVPGGREVGARLVAHPGIDKVAFTGSTAAGRRIGETCGRLLRPVTLELGGKSAAIVLDDAELDLSALAERLFTATLLNSGQTCFLSTRVLAPRSRYGEVVDLFTDLARGLRIGDALDPETQIGPLASAQQRDSVEAYIAKGSSEGGRLTTGGARPKSQDRGWFVEPTVFADVDNSSTIAQEEIFGPVLSITPYRDVDDAVRLANDSDFGLAGTVWTGDHERGVAVARRIRTGSVGINNYLPDPTAPFGGVKASGMGRELGPEGLANYQQLKSIYV
jgi:aldehyde dehydrogenase (NAD+)